VILELVIEVVRGSRLRALNQQSRIHQSTTNPQSKIIKSTID
jgi:hypothetical protein